MRREVTCANREKPHEYVKSIGGPGWSMPAEKAIEAINKGDEFFVNVGTKKVDVIVIQMNGKHFLKTKRDHSYQNNLDNLPPCK